MSEGLEECGPNYFDSAYRNYDTQNPAAKLEHYLDVIRARLHAPRPHLLDLGCGRGLFLRYAHDRHPEWVLAGTDRELDGVTASSTLVPEATIRQGLAHSIPFPAASFDVVTAWDVLEHVTDLGGALSDITRCLRPGGLLAMVVPVYDGITGPLIRALDRDPSHIHKESREFWTDLIGAHFEQVEWHGIYRYMVSRSRYVHRVTRRLRRNTPAILITAVRV